MKKWLVFVLVIAPVAVLAATASGPLNPSSTADAIGAAVDAIKALGGHQYVAALSLILMILGWVLKQPWAGSLFARIPAQYRPLAMTVLGGLSVTGVLMHNGVSPLHALLTGVGSGLGAIGAWELLDAHVVTPIKDANEIKTKLVEIGKMPDGPEKAAAQAELAKKFQ